MNVVIHFQFLGETNPTPANFGDILKSFLTVFRFYLQDQGHALKKETIFLEKIVDPPFTVHLQFEDEIDDDFVSSTIDWMKEIWSGVRTGNQEQINQLLGGLRLNNIEEILGTSLPHGILDLTHEQGDRLDEHSPSLGKRAKIPGHIARAKNWDFEQK